MVEWWRYIFVGLTLGPPLFFTWLIGSWILFVFGWFFTGILLNIVCLSKPDDPVYMPWKARLALWIFWPFLFLSDCLFEKWGMILAGGDIIIMSRDDEQ